MATGRKETEFPFGPRVPLFLSDWREAGPLWPKVLPSRALLALSTGGTDGVCTANPAAQVPFRTWNLHLGAPTPGGDHVHHFAHLAAVPVLLYFVRTVPPTDLPAS